MPAQCRAAVPGCSAGQQRLAARLHCGRERLCRSRVMGVQAACFAGDCRSGHVGGFRPCCQGPVPCCVLRAALRQGRLHVWWWGPRLAGHVTHLQCSATELATKPGRSGHAGGAPCWPCMQQPRLRAAARLAAHCGATAAAGAGSSSPATDQCCCALQCVSACATVALGQTRTSTNKCTRQTC